MSFCQTSDVSLGQGLRVVPGLKVALLEHQQVGLEWMLGMESSPVRGGILADGMGCGKTVTSIALVVASTLPPLTQQPTLVVCTKSLVCQWETEFREKVEPGLIKVLRYTGTHRNKSEEYISGHHVVITTYDTVRNEWPGPVSRKAGAPNRPEQLLMKINWHRVILDEAHVIRNSKASCSLAASALRAVFRWCITGTMIQETKFEYYSYFRFLRLKDWKDEAFFNQEMSNNVNLFALRQDICLQRAKEDLNLGIPGKSISVVRVPFLPAEARFYQDLQAHLDSQRKGPVAGAGSFAQLLRLRLACCHPTLNSELGPTESSEMDRCRKIIKGWAQDIKDSVQHSTCLPGKLCPGCDTPTEKPIIMPCGHIHCGECSQDDVLQCPSCGADVDQAKLVPLDIHRKLNPRTLNHRKHRRKEDIARLEQDSKKRVAAAAPLLEKYPSAKLGKMMEILTLQRGEKTIVFTQFMGMLDLAEAALVGRHKSIRFDGSSSQAMRDLAVQTFENDPETSVLLCALASGCLGLNLTSANHVIFLDVWWNPAVMDQAIDRIHRIHQTKECSIHIIAIQDTIEESILTLNKIKRKRVDYLLTEPKPASQRIQDSDLVLVFGLDRAQRAAGPMLTLPERDPPKRVRRPKAVSDLGDRHPSSEFG